MIKPIFIYPVKRCSTRLPEKNLLTIKGVPLFVHGFRKVLKAASKYEDSKVYLSTESDLIKEKTQRYFGYSQYTIHMRDEKFAKDPYQNIHVCAVLLTSGYDFDDCSPIVMVQPTNPLITPEDIHNCIELWEQQDKDELFFEEVRAVKELPNCRIFENTYNSKWASKVDFYTRYFESLGSIIVTDSKRFIEWDGKIDSLKWSEDIIPYVLPKERAIDIDDETDFLMAKALMEK